MEPPAPPEDVSTILASALSWASGGMISTPGELNRFARGYVDGRLFGSATQTAQFDFIDGASSDPPGPGSNAAGLGIFRYRTRCGAVFGHTGNYPGYTQFFAANHNGGRSVTVSVNEQLRPDLKGDVFDALRETEVLAVCAGLARQPH